MTSAYIIPGEDAYLLALLNSKLLDLYFRLSMPCLDDPFNGGDMRVFSGVFMEYARPSRRRNRI